MAIKKLQNEIESLDGWRTDKEQAKKIKEQLSLVSEVVEKWALNDPEGVEAWLGQLEEEGIDLG